METFGITSLSSVDRKDAPAPGTTVDGRYVLRRVVAAGGMSVVFEAEHALLRGTVALKLLAPEAAHAAEPRERLLREGRALWAVRHPAVVEIHDAGVCPRFGPYLVLEMLEGRTLSGLLAARGQLGVGEAAHVARQLCDALSFVHSRGIVHRDVKPGNVFVARMRHGGEAVKLLDFGIAAFRGDAPGASERRLTTASAVLGTPEYMSPEQLMRVADVDERADVYGTAATLFEALTGQVPFPGTYPEILYKVGTHQAAPPVRAARPEVPDAMAAVVARALATERDARYDSSAAFGAALAAVASHLPRAALLDEGTVEQRSPSPEPGVRGQSPRVIARDEDPNGANLPVVLPPQRRRARAPYVTPVTLWCGGATLEGRSENISAGGLLVVSAGEWSPGVELTVSFALPGTGEEIDARAVVRWTRPARNMTAMGLELLALAADAEAAIESFVRDTQ